MYREINYKFVSFDGFVSPKAIGRPDGEGVYSTICIKKDFAMEWTGSPDEGAMKEFLERMEIDTDNAEKPPIDATKFVTDAMAAGSLAFVDMPIPNRHEGYFFPQNYPDGSVSAVYELKNAEAIEDDANRQVNMVLFDSDCAPDTIDIADAMVAQQYPHLTYRDVLKAIPAITDAYTTDHDCNRADNDIWEGCVKNVLHQLEVTKARSVA